MAVNVFKELTDRQQQGNVSREYLAILDPSYTLQEVKERLKIVNLHYHPDKVKKSLVLHCGGRPVMEQVYVTVRIALEEMKAAFTNNYGKVTENAEERRLRDSEDEKAREEAKAKITRDGAEHLKRLREQDDATALQSINDNDTPICLLEKDDQYNTHKKPSSTPSSHNFIS